tara:strand:- start:30568 stop:31095 length:528 start_codon:yes stop_codon:yes gene_type:complete
MELFHRLDAFLERFYHLVGSLVGISIGLFAVAISLDLVLRLAKLSTLSGMQEIIEYILFAGVFLGAPWVLRSGSHVRVDLVISSLPSNVARVFDRALDLLGLAVCCVLVWFGVLNLQFAFASNSLQMKYFNIPEWWLLAVFVVSFTLMAFEFLSRIIRGGDGPEAGKEENNLEAF